MEQFWLNGTPATMLSNGLRGIQNLHACLFSHDLAHIPLRFSGLPKEILSQRGIPARKKIIKGELAG